MDALLKDIRYSVRRLIKSPGFTAVVVLTLALGIGANTAIFSVVNAVLLRPLPYRAPEQLVTLYHFYPSLNDLKAPVSTTGFRDYRDRARVFDKVAVESGWGANMTGRGDPERVNGSRVSGQFFQVLGVGPELGRTLLPEEDTPGKEKVVVLSYGLWQRLFGGRPDAVGQKLTLNGEDYEVVGVMPARFRDFFNRSADLWRPLALPPEQYNNDNARTNEWLNLTGRLREGLTIEQAQREFTTFAEQLKKDYTVQYPPNWGLVVTSLQEVGTGRIRPALLILLGAVGFVLLIACANVANLLLARAAARLKEVAIRSALGAKRWHLVRQLLTESVLLAVAGGALGLVLAYWGVRSLVAFNPDLSAADVRVDGAVTLFTLAVSVGTGLLFGLAPALQASKANLQETLKEGGRTAAADRGGQTLRRTLVVAEVALSLMLLVGAGLLIRSFARLQGVSPGFEPRGVLTFNLALPRAKYPSDTAQIAFYDRVLAELAAVPGVQSVGATSVMPFGGSWSTGTFSVEGYNPGEGQPRPWGDIRVVSPGFLPAIKAPLLKGRLLTDQDAAGAPRVVVVDAEAAKRFWPNDDPVGKRITRGGPPGQENWITVVGVVGHTAHEGLDAEKRVQIYFPYRQQGTPFMSLAVRTAGDPTALVPAVRRAVHAVDKDQPLSGIKTMEELVEQSVGQRRLSMLLLGVFAGIALLLASVGIYGVMSYAVTQRAHELGVRMALGAARGNVLALVMRQGMLLALAGVVLGLLGAFALTRLIEGQLYQVPATDPLTFAAVALLLTGVASVATLVPALRATRVDPVVALRDE